MIRLNSHVIATSVASTWLPVTLLGHCVAVFQPCDGLTFYRYRQADWWVKDQWDASPTKIRWIRRNRVWAKASFAPAAIFVCCWHLDEVSTPYPLTLVRFTHSIACGYVISSWGKSCCEHSEPISIENAINGYGESPSGCHVSHFRRKCDTWRNLLSSKKRKPFLCVVFPFSHSPLVST